MKKLIIITLAILTLSTGIVLAAPWYNYGRSFLPIDSTENLGTTTAPWAELHVNRICLTADCKTAWPVGGGGTGTGWASTTDTFSIYFSGRDYVGIGTTSPYAKLSVVGQVVASHFHATSTTATTTISNQASFGSTGLAWLGNQGVGDTTSATFLDSAGTTRCDHLSSGAIGVQCTTSSAGLTTIIHDSGEDEGLNITNGSINFTAANATNAFQGIGNGYVTLNLGAGSTSPTMSVSASGKGYFGNNVIASYFTATSSIASSLPYASSTMISTSAGAHFATDESLDAKVGIGMTPTARLSIDGEEGGGISALTVSLANDVTNAVHFYDTADSIDYLRMGKEGSYQVLTVFQDDIANGRMGIGTSSPKWPLQISSQTVPQLALSDGSATSPIFTIRTVSGTTYFGTSSTQGTFATSSTSMLEFRNTGTGMAGFGTSTPTSLHNNTAAFQGSIYVGKKAGTTNQTSTSTFEGSVRILGTNQVGDLAFANGFYITEKLPIGKENQALIFKNQNGEEILTLDDKGNLSKGVKTTYNNYWGLLGLFGLLGLVRRKR